MNEQKMTRPEALKRALPILIVTIIGAVIIGLLALRTIRNLNAVAPTSQDFSLLAPVCAGNGLPATALYDRQTTTHPAVMVRLVDGEWATDLAVIPAEFRPDTIGDVQLVLCVSPPETVTYPVCDASATVMVEQAVVRLAAARTGVTIAEDLVHDGNLTGDCRPAEAGEPASVTDAILWEWLQPYVTSGSAS